MHIIIPIEILNPYKDTRSTLLKLDRSGWHEGSFIVRRESASTFGETRLKILMLKRRNCWEQEMRMRHLEDVRQGKWKIRLSSRWRREDDWRLFAGHLEYNEDFGWEDDLTDSGSLPLILDHFGKEEEKWTHLRKEV